MTIVRKIMAHAKSIFAIAFTIVTLSCASPAAFAQNAQDTQASSATTPQQASQVQDDVLSALVNLGYQQASAEKAIGSVKESTDFDALFRQALGMLRK